MIETLSKRSFEFYRLQYYSGTFEGIVYRMIGCDRVVPPCNPRCDVLPNGVARLVRFLTCCGLLVCSLSIPTWRFTVPVFAFFSGEKHRHDLRAVPLHFHW